MSGDALIEVDHVDKVFRTRHVLARHPDTQKRVFYHTRVVHAVKDVAFSVPRGVIFGLLGPNGAGKTTTVKMLSGLVRPTTGAVRVDGMDVNKQRGKTLGKVGVVLEGTRTSIWPLTPLENLDYFGSLKGIRGREIRERAHLLLEFIGLSEKADTQTRHLSRGQKQKLAICIALIANPSVLLLDEPTTGLDVQSSRTIKDRIVEMARERGLGVLVTTHDMHVAQELCDRIGIIKDGALVACRPTDELLDVFGDQTYHFRLDREPGDAIFADIPGAMFVRRFEDGADHVLAMTLDAVPSTRSAALFTLVERMRENGHELRAINQVQTNLEQVFLRVTGEPNTGPVEAEEPVPAAAAQ